MPLLLDQHYMQMALNMARRGLGHTAPNPSVGCVLVKEGIIVGRGWTARGGRPHAETIAIENAGMEARGATAYVSLEPCAHQGQTPPCAKALIDAGIARVVIACTDPDPRVSGQGIEILRQAGITVEAGVMEEEARTLNAGFILSVEQKRCFVTLKSATSSDHKITTEPGTQTWITGREAQNYAHLERSQHDAILIGSETFLTDKPQLTTRIDGYEHEIQRFVMDRSGRVKDEDAKGFTILRKSADIKGVVEALAELGITRLLVEGGAKVNTSFLESGYCDRFLWFKAPQEIGSGGVDALFERDIGNIEQDFGLKKQKTRKLGEDLLAIYERKA